MFAIVNKGSRRKALEKVSDFFSTVIDDKIGNSEK